MWLVVSQLICFSLFSLYSSHYPLDNWFLLGIFCFGNSVLLVLYLMSNIINCYDNGYVCVVIPSQIPQRMFRRTNEDKQEMNIRSGLIIHLAMRPFTRHIKYKGNRKRRSSVYQTEVEYLVYAITSQGFIDNTEHCCRNHSIIGNMAGSYICGQWVFRHNALKLVFFTKWQCCCISSL